MEIDCSYRSYGEHNITSSFLIPALSRAVFYRRSVGFFSSSVFCSILEGIRGLVENKGRVQLIVSPKLSEQDVAAINKGYLERRTIIQKATLEEFNKAFLTMNDRYFDTVTELIKYEFLDVKIAYTRNPEYGMYHDKFGLITDADDNTIEFAGSPNDTYFGLSGAANYEKIRVHKSWIAGQDAYVQDAIAEFESLWSDSNAYLEVFNFTEAIKRRLFEIIEHAERPKHGVSSFHLRDYQEEAIQNWFNNECRGFFVMATGTGKTLTAVYAAKRLYETDNPVIVVVAPYKHLLKQWEQVIRDHLRPDVIIGASSDVDHLGWQERLSKACFRRQYDSKVKIVVIITNRSFGMPDFTQLMDNTDFTKMLLVDEAHRFVNGMRPELRDQYRYLLGLSATPVSGGDPHKRGELLDFFGGVVANFPIDDALKSGKLCPYDYHPIFVHATEQEEERFNNLSRQIARCFENDKLIVSLDDFLMKKAARLRVIGTASQKIAMLDDILKQAELKDHFIIYCGDGKIIGKNKTDETMTDKRYLQVVKEKLDCLGYRMSQFTASETMKERMELIDCFTDCDIHGLVAIRCLDEGIDIPSIKKAVILSSGDNIREFVQRRGRILRLHENKEYADIYDVLVLPSDKCPKMAEMEFRRFYEYARLARNHYETLPLLDSYIKRYRLDEKNIYDYFDNVDSKLEDCSDE